MHNYKNSSILFMCAGFGGGLGKMLRFVSSACVGQFGSVMLLHRGAESLNDVAPSGVEEIVIPVSKRSSMLKWRWSQIQYIRKIVSEKQPDIICSFSTETAAMGTIALLGMKHGKVVLAERGDPFTFPLIWKCLSQLAYLKADNCVFQLEKQGMWYGKMVMKKSTVIPNPYVPTGEVVPFSGEREKQIVSVGRFVAEKRFEVLIDAFKVVHEVYPDFRLVIFGDGPFRSKYEQMIQAYGLEDCVDLPGYSKNAMNDIRDSSVFVLSSLYEGIPNTLIEALSIGVPTVSTDCTPGGPDFLTDHGRRGLLVPVNDVKAMSAAIIKIISNPSFANQLSVLGREIISDFDKEKIASKWVQFFKAVLMN